jgi:hypothetical protein
LFSTRCRSQSLPSAKPRRPDNLRHRAGIRYAHFLRPSVADLDRRRMRGNARRHALRPLKRIALLPQHLSRDFRAQGRMPGQSRDILNGGNIVQPSRQFHDLQVRPQRLTQPLGVLGHNRQMLLEERRAKCVLATVALVEHVFSNCYRNHATGGMPKSLQIFFARLSTISVCRGTADRRFRAGLCHHECLLPSRRNRHPCSSRYLRRARRFIRRFRPRRSRPMQTLERPLG